MYSMYSNHLKDILALGASAKVFATKVNADSHCYLACLGGFEELRYRYNQMACLIASAVLATLQGPEFGAIGVASGYGTWNHPLLRDLPVSPDMLLQLAARGPNEAADFVGYLIACDRWPTGVHATARTTAMRRSMAEVGNLFYHFTTYPTVLVGNPHARSAQLRAEASIRIAKHSGCAPFEEERLVEFMATLTKSRALHLFHEVRL